MEALFQFNAIHIGCSEQQLRAMNDLVTERGGTTFELPLAGIADRDMLVATFVDIFDIPWPIRGLDAVISTASDLDWISDRESYCVQIKGADAATDAVLRDTVVALTRIIDRMRGAGERYVAMFPESPGTSHLVALLNTENESLAELERIDPASDTHPVPVIDHRVDPVAES